MLLNLHILNAFDNISGYRRYMIIGFLRSPAWRGYRGAPPHCVPRMPDSYATDLNAIIDDSFMNWLDSLFFLWLNIPGKFSWACVLQAEFDQWCFGGLQELL